MRPPRAIPLLLTLLLCARPLYAQIKAGAAADAAAGGTGQIGTSLNTGLAAPIANLSGVTFVAPLAVSAAPSAVLAAPVPALGPAAAVSAIRPAAPVSAPVSAVPAVAKSGTVARDLGRTAAAVSASAAKDDAAAAGDALFDARRKQLQQDDAVGLILNGYRFGDDGRVFAPNTGAPVTNADIRTLKNSFQEGRLRRALLRLEGETAPGAAGANKDALLRVNRDALPREVRKAAPDNQRNVLLRRLASLYRRWLSRPEGTVPDTVTPAGAEAEERLGALISASALKTFSADPEGRRLLDELKDETGKTRMPTIRVLRLDERYGALYTNLGRQLIISLDYLRGRLVARLPEGEREAAAKSLATEASALAYLSSRPDRLATLFDAVDVTVYHELVHFMQDIKRPLMGATSTEKVYVASTLEHEYEAYFRQDLYIHSRLARPGARLDIERLDDYLRLIQDFEGWRANIESLYREHFVNGTIGLDDMSRLQASSRALMKRLSDSDKSLPTNRLRNAAAGSADIAVEKAASKAALDALRARWPKTAREGMARWAELSLEHGKPNEAALAYEHMARRARAEGSPHEELAKKAEAYADKALIRLASPEGLTLDERIQWINGLAGFFNGRGSLWKKELWVASFRDNALKAAALRADAAKAPDGRTRAALLASAEQFEAAVNNNRATLRGNAEAHLAMARAEKKPEALRALLEWGAMEAGVLGDAPLIAAFKDLAASKAR